MILPQPVCVFGIESARNLRSVQRNCAKKQTAGAREKGKKIYTH